MSMQMIIIMIMYYTNRLCKEKENIVLVYSNNDIHCILNESGR